jgi:hypothetical protein
LIERGHTIAVVAETSNTVYQIVNAFINREGRDAIAIKKVKKYNPTIGVTQRLKNKHVGFSMNPKLAPESNSTLVAKKKYPLFVCQVKGFQCRLSSLRGMEACERFGIQCSEKDRSNANPEKPISC